MISRKHNSHIARILTLSLVWLILLSADAAASDWFVRPAGGDYGNEDGSSYENAWDGLNSVVWDTGGVVAGDTLYVCGLHHRTYSEVPSYENFFPEVSGTEGNIITIRGDYPGDPGIIWGAGIMAKSAWNDEGNGVWSYVINGNRDDRWYFEDITANSWTVLTMVRDVGTLTGTWTFTNGSTTVRAAGDGDAQTELDDGDYIKLSDESNPQRGGTWYKVNGEPPDADTITIDRVYARGTETDAVNLTIKSDTSGSLALMDATPGTFYCGDYRTGSKLYVHCSDSQDPTGRISGNRLGYNLKAYDYDYVTWLNLKTYCIFRWFEGTTTEGKECDNIVWQGCTLWYGGESIAKAGSFHTNLSWIDCDVGWSDAGIGFGEVPRDGQGNGPRGIVIRNCVIHDMGVTYGSLDKHGIMGNGVIGGLIENNEIYNCGTSICFYQFSDSDSLQDIIIRWNYIHDTHLSWGATSGHGIELAMTNTNVSENSGNEIYGNIVANIVGIGYKTSFPVYLMPFYNNIAYNCGTSFRVHRIGMPTGQNIRLRNNISLFPTEHHIVFHTDVDEGSYTYDSDYNIFYPVSGDDFFFNNVAMTYAEWQALSKSGCTFDPHSIVADPLFVDPENDNFNLIPGSLAIDAGVDVGLTQGFGGNPIPLGSAPDIGAYEAVIDPNNPPPVLQAIGDKSVDENVALTFTVNATDPNSEPITYLVQSLPSGATLDSQTGDFSWTPSYTQAGSYQVRFIASDDNSNDSETITITVSNVNRPPVLGAISDPSVDENDLLNISVSATDPDGQALTYSVSGLPNGAVFASQTFTWTPSYDQAGTFAVTFTADDGQGQDSQVVTITVINVNRAPVFTAINNKSIWSDDPLTFTIDATDPDGDAVTYSANTVPSGATFITETFDWTPTAAQIGTYDVTFYASDGLLQDSEAITITVNVDSLAPTITNLSPAAGAIQVPLNNLITLNVTDAGKGINTNSVKIKVKINSNPNNTEIYFGDLDHDITLLGDCRRIGNNADYKFVFQPAQDLFYNDQTITITVNATDLAGNVMDSYIYSFVTEMHLFGQNKLVNTNLDNNDRPVTVCDSNGNIWATWHTGSAGSRDIYIGTLAAGADNFGNIVQLTNDETDQCNPVLALDSNDKIYAVWQDNREGDWDIYISTSVDGINWAVETRVNDPNNGNQINPAIVIDSQSPSYAHVVWQDDRAGNQDICIAASSNDFTTKTVSPITSDASDQVEPAVVADSTNTIYVVWTDGRNGSSDIYGAASNSGPWTNVAVVSNANNQSSPTIAAESTGSILHLLWVDDTPGDNDIYYASSNNGLPGSPLTGSSIIDDTSSADQLEPTIAITGTTSNEDLKVFACWQDWRNTDTDLYFVELNASSGTNVFVNDGGSNAYQSEPTMGIDEYGYPYLIWADDRNTNTDIYYTASTFIEPVALASALVSASAPGSTIIGVDPQAITDVDDVSIVLPAGACLYDVDISIVTILNQQVFATPCYGSYDFGPSGIQFNQPVMITIPYIYADSNGTTVPYWFNSLTGTLSQQGITNVRDIVISPTLHAVSFETTHFTPFYLLGGDAAVVLSGGGGGGGCSVSAGNEGNIVEFVLPYIVLFVVMAIIKKRDARYRRVHST